MMRRLFQRLLRVATATSVLLFVAAVVLWVRSYRVWDSVSGGGERVDLHPYSVHGLTFRLVNGVFYCEVRNEIHEEGSPRAAEARARARDIERRLSSWCWARLPPEPRSSERPFVWTATDVTGHPPYVWERAHHIYVPWWAVVAASAVWPSAAFAVALRRRIRRGGRVPGPRRWLPRSLPELRRRALAVLAVLSAVVFVAAVLLWVRSYWVEERLTRIARRVGPHPYWEHNLHLETARGAFLCVVQTVVYAEETDQARTFRGRADEVNGWLPTWEWHGRRDPRSFQDRGLRLFRWTTQSANWPGDYSSTASALLVPWWVVAAAAAALPSAWAVVALRRRRDRRRLERGLCRRCGYDLRASTERCPECGEPVTRAAPVAQGANL